MKVLFVSFRANPAPQTDPKAKKILSEAEAKAKIEKLLGQIRAGADFVKLVKENSDDADSIARDGDFGPPIRRSDDSLPADIKNAIFALKPGKVTDALRVPSGFYLFRLEEFHRSPTTSSRRYLYRDPAETLQRMAGADGEEPGRKDCQREFFLQDRRQRHARPNRPRPECCYMAA